MAESKLEEEYLDVLTPKGEKTGTSKRRKEVHRDGDYHRAIHVLIFAESTQQLLIQRRSDCKDSWPGAWDVSSAGHVVAGDSSLNTAQKELQEELGLNLPESAFEFLFTTLQEATLNDGTFINNEFNDVYLVTTLAPILLEAFSLQESEVSAVRYISLEEYKQALARNDPAYVHHNVSGQYGQLFDIISQRYKSKIEDRTLSLQKQLNRYANVRLNADLTLLPEADRETLSLLVKAGTIIDEIFCRQVWYSNPRLQSWLKEKAGQSDFDELKWRYFAINKSPWSCLDENRPFLTTADSAVHLLPEATKPVPGWKGIEYRVAVPISKPLGATFYPPDMDKKEFEIWKETLEEDELRNATGLLHVIKRENKSLHTVPYSQEYHSFLVEVSDLLHKAGNLTNSASLKKFLHTRADALHSNYYYNSDIAWMELNSVLDVTIGPYETYQDDLFSYKATFEAFIGVRDDIATSQARLFGEHLQLLESNLPLDHVYKSSDVRAAPIRVIHLVYNAGDVKGPQTVAFNLPIVKERGTSMVILKNVSEAKFQHILRPMADICISNEQREYIDFESFFIHTVCRECCHGIGPHVIMLPNGKKSTVRMELQELHSSFEEAKADIVGLWALKFLVDKGLLPKYLQKPMYVSFLAGCFRSVRFGLVQAHGKGQALQFNWLFENGGFIMHNDGTFSVDFNKVEGAVESLCRVILAIQSKGDKHGAATLVEKYCKVTDPLNMALKKLEMIQVPVDIFPTFPVADEILGRI